MAHRVGLPLLLLLAACSAAERSETIAPRIDVEKETQTQRWVDDGSDPWRPDAASVGCVEIAGFILERQKKLVDADACVKGQAVRKSSAAEATVAFTFGDSEYVVELKRLVKPGGIWTPTRIDIHPRG
jgi:hypothetical protein